MLTTDYIVGTYLLGHVSWRIGELKVGPYMLQLASSSSMADTRQVSRCGFLLSGCILLETMFEWKLLRKMVRSKKLLGVLNYRPIIIESMYKDTLNLRGLVVWLTCLEFFQRLIGKMHWDKLTITNIVPNKGIFVLWVTFLLRGVAKHRQAMTTVGKLQYHLFWQAF